MRNVLGCCVHRTFDRIEYVRLRFCFYIRKLLIFNLLLLKLICHLHEEALIWGCGAVAPVDGVDEVRGGAHHQVLEAETSQVWRQRLHRSGDGEPKGLEVEPRSKSLYHVYNIFWISILTVCTVVGRFGLFESNLGHLFEFCPYTECYWASDIN